MMDNDMFEINATIKEAIKDLVDKKIIKDIMEMSTNTLNTTCTTVDYKPFDLEKFIEANKEEIEWNNMTLEERTLKATKEKYDTIIVPNSEIRYKLIEEFGELNYIVSSLSKDVILVNASKFISGGWK